MSLRDNQSDRQVFEELLTRRGFGYESKPDGIELRAEEGLVGGYWGFVAWFGFDADGRLREIEVWE